MSVGTSLTWKRKSPYISGAKPEEDNGEFTRKKLKLSDLPLGSAQRSTIDALLFKFKKSGEFDKLRKAVFAQFEGSQGKNNMIQSLDDLTETEIANKASYLLSKERRQAAALLEGAAERSNIYRTAENDIDKLVQDLLGQAEDSMRDIRRRDIGEDAALEELKKGGKTDEDYLREFEERKAARLKIIEEENAKIKQQEEEDRIKAAEEKRRRKEEEEAKEKEREEREAKRRAEREEREKEREKELEREREERRERRRKEEERVREESHER
ncbi:hypothetical protein EJ08DRAFT_594200, partial [Tothia fuscella]